jgi:ABC-2 type transport system ATP-binding protein
MNPAAITIENLTKFFPAGRWPSGLTRRRAWSSQTEVLRGVSLDVLRGEILGLVGPNGAGKTTLLEILATLLIPTRGRAEVEGYDVVHEPQRVKRVLAYCPCDSRTFYPRLSGRQNLEFFAFLNDLPARECRKRVDAVLDLVEMNGARHLPFQQFSEGMKQRLAVARALITNPRVLLLDEPTRSLDPLWQADIRDFLRRTLVGELGKTVLLVTHNMTEAEQICDRVALLHAGSIVFSGPPHEASRTFGGSNLGEAFRRAVGARS